MLDKRITYGDSVLTFGGGTRLLYLNNEFVLELTITGSSQTITLPTQQRTPEWVYNCSINWGDGNTTTMTDRTSAGRIHTYTNPGVYELSISGTYECFRTYNGTEMSQGDIRPIMHSITKILNWGYVGMKEMDFWGCDNLTSINPNNGSYLSSLTSPNNDWMFAGCINLTTIPADLFSDMTEQTSFYGAFFRCKKLTSIPAGLFDVCTKVTTFGYCFTDCYALTSIPTDLFKYNTKVVSFENTFSGCKELTSIPTDLFRYNIDTVNFQSTFGQSYDFPYVYPKITSIPATLFTYNTGVTNFGMTFYHCTLLTGNTPTLWSTHTLVTTHSYCFQGDTSLTNYASIPSDWK